MRKLIYLVLLIFGIATVNAQEPKIKIDLKDGNVKEYNLEDIENMQFIHSNLSYSMLIYKKGESQSINYDIRQIDSIWFENNLEMKMLKRENLITYNISDIDSIFFVFNECDEIQIGNQIWMCKNLDVSHYRNGDSIPEVQDPTAWENLTTGVWCYYKNDQANGEIYGKLYNWYAVNDPRGLAPVGWHVPTDEEWTELVNYLGGSSVAGGKLKATGTIEGGDGLWRSPNEGATNEIGFSALPGGYRYNDGSYSSLGTTCTWWSATESTAAGAWNRSLFYYHNNVGRYYYGKGHGFSVRCVRD